MKQIGFANEILPYGADLLRRDEWLEARRTGVTASEIGTILGFSKWDSPLSLYFKKTGALDEEPDNWRMALGRALEPYVLSCFTELTGLEVTHAGLLQSVERPWQLCTPDGLTEENIPVEAKTTVAVDDWGPSGTDQVPLSYRAQLLWQCDVLGASHGYLVVVPLRSGEPRWYDIPWDAWDVAVMREAGEKFMKDVESFQPPAVDGSEATTNALRRVNLPDNEAPTVQCGPGLIRSFRAAYRRKHEADGQYKLIENKVRDLMGPSVRMTGPDGTLVATRRVFTRKPYTVKETVIDALYAGAAVQEGM